MNELFQTRILTILAVVLVAMLLNSCQKEYTITVVANNANLGMVSGGGVYKKGEFVELVAKPAGNCHFEKWDDGNTDNPRTITINGNITYTAVFAIENNFSISETKKVLFSPGNLQWSASGSHVVAGGRTAAGTWRFAPNQLDTIGIGNNNISSTYTGWIDLFGCGTSGYDNKYPYMTSTTNSDYVNKEDDITGTYYDWGGYNAIYNPHTNTTDAPGTWRTLTKNEWDYLLNTRNTASNIRFARGIVCGIAGVIIVRDDWDPSIYSLNDVNTIEGITSYTSNIIDASDWAKMEAAGCVFLPTAGYREETSVSGVGSYGFYWSSTCHYYYSAFSMYFNSSNIHIPCGSLFRYYGNSVRLVKDVK